MTHSTFEGKPVLADVMPCSCSYKVRFSGG